jgi:hypothetical protein
MRKPGVFVYETKRRKEAPQAEDGFTPNAPPTKEDFRFWREEGEAKTNVPWRAKEHSPTGFEWGYEGSGPSDLALNLLEEVLLGLHHKGARTECFAGSCFVAAWLAHWDFRRQFIATLPRAGGALSREAVEVWLAGWLINYEAKQGHK